jgi:hypothetical protein
MDENRERMTRQLQIAYDGRLPLLLADLNISSIDFDIEVGLITLVNEHRFVVYIKDYTTGVKEGAFLAPVGRSGVWLFYVMRCRGFFTVVNLFYKGSFLGTTGFWVDVEERLLREVLGRLNNRQKIIEP